MNPLVAISNLVKSVFSGSAAPKVVRNATIENPSMSLQDPRTWDELLGGTQSEAGVVVTHEVALSLAPVWQAVSLISGDVASLPFHVYKRLENDDREIDYNHPAEYLIADQPNDETSAFEFWRRLMTHALLWQNGYAYIRRKGGSGDPLELLNLLPDRTTCKRDDKGELYYVTEVDGQLVPIPAKNILHVKGLSLGTGEGYDLLKAARNAWGLALAAQGFESKFFANGSQAGGILELPAQWSEQAKKQVEEGWSKRYTGKDNWFRTVILRDGAKFHQVTISPQDSQLSDLRENQVREIARFFNLPPFKLGLSDSVSYNSTEQSQLVYLASCLRHWLAAINGEARIKLLKQSQRYNRTHFLEHNTSKIIELDVKTLNEVLNIQRSAEVINANEWRRKINLNARKDPGGEEYANPNTKSNVGTGAESVEKPVKTGEEDYDSGEAKGETGNDSGKIQDAQRVLVRNELTRFLRRIGHDAKSQAKNSGKFLAWLDAGALAHRSVFDEAMRPSFHLISLCNRREDHEADDMLDRTAAALFTSVITRLKPLVEPPYSANDLVLNVSAECERIEAELPDQIVPIALRSLA